MKPNSRRYVKIRVSMMNAVEPPEQGQCMKENMLNLDDKIKNNDCKQNFDPER